MFFNVANAYALLFIISLIRCSPLVTSGHEILPSSHTARGLRLPVDDSETELELLMAQEYTDNEDVYVPKFRDGFAEDYYIQPSIILIPEFKYGILIIVSTGKFVWIGSNNTANEEEVNRLLTGTSSSTTSRRSLREDLRERDGLQVGTSLTQAITNSLSYGFLNNSSALIIGAGTAPDRLKNIESQVREHIRSYNNAASISSRTVRLVEETASDRTDCALRISEPPDLPNKGRRIEIYLGVYRYGNEPFMQQDVATKGNGGNRRITVSLEEAKWRLGDRKPEISESC